MTALTTEEVETDLQNEPEGDGSFKERGRKLSAPWENEYFKALAVK